MQCSSREDYQLPHKLNTIRNKGKANKINTAMAQIRVPKSFKDRQDELSIKMYKDKVTLERQGYAPEQITRALMLRYKVSKNTVYRHTRRAPDLLTPTEG